MFLIDNLLLLPMTGTLRLVRAIESAAAQETTERADALRAELTELYQALEAGGISSDEFNAREAQLLDQLDTIESRQLKPETPGSKP